MRTLLLASLLAAPAWASSTYPAAVQTHLACAMQSCALCHVNGLGAAGTANTPFGTTLRGKGAAGANEPSLLTALDAMAAANSDSDGDGVGDIAELKAGTDPNAAPSDGGAGGGGGTVPPLTYGCGSDAMPGLSGLWGLLVFLGLRRERRPPFALRVSKR